MTVKKQRYWPVALLGAALAAPLGFALPRTWAEVDDHDEALRLREAGEIVSLRSIVESVERQHSGRLMEVKLENEDGRYLYEIEILGTDGVVHELYYDARSGAALPAMTEVEGDD